MVGPHTKEWTLQGQPKGYLNGNQLEGDHWEDRD
jgi:hypothetical protein